MVWGLPDEGWYGAPPNRLRPLKIAINSLPNQDYEIIGLNNSGDDPYEDKKVQGMADFLH